MICPKCGGEMKSCCQLAREAAHGQPYGHTCGQQMLICIGKDGGGGCGYYEYNDTFLIPLFPINVKKELKPLKLCLEINFGDKLPYSVVLRHTSSPCDFVSAYPIKTLDEAIIAFKIAECMVSGLLSASKEDT